MKSRNIFRIIGMAIIIVLMLVAVASGQKKHQIKMQFTITFDSLTLAEAVKVEEMIQEKLHDKKCEIKMIVIDLPEFLLVNDSIFPRWHELKFDTINNAPLMLNCFAYYVQLRERKRL